MCEILSCIFILKEEKYDRFELKIKILHYVCVQLVTKAVVAEAFLVLRGLNGLFSSLSGHLYGRLGGAAAG